MVLAFCNAASSAASRDGKVSSDWPLPDASCVCPNSMIEYYCNRPTCHHLDDFLSVRLFRRIVVDRHIRAFTCISRLPLRVRCRSLPVMSTLRPERRPEPRFYENGIHLHLCGGLLSAGLGMTYAVSHSPYAMMHSLPTP